MSQRILIVEDVFIEATDLRIILERAGHKVIGMPKSVDQAMGAVKRDRPDIVLLDIFLKGDLTGIHLAKYLASVNIPFIYLSANSNHSTLEAAKATQPYGFLVKPFREKDILVALDIAAHRHQHVQEMTQHHERWLASLLGGIINQAATQEQKLLMLAKAFKTFIPFDVLFIDMDRGSEELRDFFGCKRVDFDHFLSMDMGKLLSKIRLTPGELPLFRGAFPYRQQITIVRENDLPGIGNRVTDRLQRLFGFRSILSVPVSTEKENSFSIFFFSAHPESYTNEQIEVLSPLRSLLTRVVADIRTQDHAFRSSTGKIPLPRDASGSLKAIVGKSAGLLHVLDQVVQVSPFESTVLITGETGVGKEGIAAAIHALSARSGRPYIKVNCAAIPDALIESELFGHERGAFTSAVDRRIGKFEQAGGGTIFLDEIGELPLPAQSKLLRVLQEKEIERVGGDTPIKVDVRIVAATNRQLHKEVAAGRFRMDLYYRLNVFPITVPPLRERKEDIPSLVEHFLKQQAALSSGVAKTLSSEVLDRLMHWHWPGNIRELQFMIERCVVQTPGPVITKAELPDGVGSGEVPAAEAAAGSTVPLTEKHRIMEALVRCNGKVSGKGGAAEALDINPHTLNSRMKKLGIEWKYILK